MNSIDDIIMSHSIDVRDFVEHNEISEQLYNSLYEYYTNQGELSYEAQKAITIDPIDEISQKFAEDLLDLGIYHYYNEVLN